MSKVSNAAIDKALKKLMALIDDDDQAKRLPPDTAVKVLAQAIAWEKVKQGSMEPEDPFREEDL